MEVKIFEEIEKWNWIVIQDIWSRDREMELNSLELFEFETENEIE